MVIIRNIMSAWPRQRPEILLQLNGQYNDRPPAGGFNRRRMVDHTRKHRKKILQAAVKTRRAALPLAANSPATAHFIGLPHQTEAVLVHLVGHDDAQEEHE